MKNRLDLQSCRHTYHRGMAIPMVVMVCVLILGLAFIIFKLSQDFSRTSARLIQREVVFHAGVSALDLLQGEIEASIRKLNVNPSATNTEHPQITNALTRLFKESTFEPIEENLGAGFQNILQKSFPDLKFELRLRVANRSPLYDSSKNIGFPHDPREQAGILFLEAEVE